MTVVQKIGAGLLFILLLSPGVDAQEIIRLTNGEWPPYLSESLEHKGFASRIVTEAFAEVGIRVEYGFFIWQRTYNQAKAGRWDGSVGWARTPEREKDFYYSNPVVEDITNFFHLKTYPLDWESIEDLKGISIGATVAYHYGDAFEHAEKTGKIEVQRAAKDQLNLKKLLRGKIQIFPMNLEVGYYQLQRTFPPEKRQLFTHHPKPLYVKPLHVIFSKKIDKNKHRLALFNKGLKQLKDRGRIDQIMKEARQEKE